MILASRITAIVNFNVHGHHADCCLTVHGPGLLDNRRLFLEQRRVGEGRKMAEKNRDEAEGERKKDVRQERRLHWQLCSSEVVEGRQENVMGNQATNQLELQHAA